VGSEHKFCGALIVPNWENMKKRFKTTNHEFPEDNLTTNKYVLSRIQKEIDKVNKDLSKWEKVKKFKLLEDQFTIENGEITPTLKVKRSVINKKYKEDIDSIYAEEES
jgi:long-chain acyl-CoA synthetase